MTLRNVGLSFAALLVGALAGCAESKLTRQNYDLIRVGSSHKDEVKSALGDQHLIDRGTQWEYDDEGKHVSVWFEFDKSGIVTRKQWWTGDGGLEHDSQAGEDGDPEPQSKKTMTIDK